MKNKEFHKLLKKNKSKSESGFTLTELLVGLIMSTIVIAGLGWGLMQILTTTKTETNKIASRGETSRAFNFIADEVKAAQTIEVNTSLTNINNNNPTDANGVAANYPPLEDADGNPIAPVLALQVPGVTQRVIYSVAPPQTGTWKGPLVIYRWGPNLNANGKYTDPDNVSEWENEALIDGVSDDSLTAVGCDMDGDGNDDDYRGFFACVLDDDGDGIAENDPTTDTNGDGVVDPKDGADTDGVSITAQLYFAAETDAGIYKTDSQVVARARVAPLRRFGLSELTPVFFESLNPQYGRFINNNNSRPCWIVRNDFGIGEDPRFDPDSTNTVQKEKALQKPMTWIHEDNRQPQPLNIDTTKPFTMVASAFAAENPDGQDFAQCLAKGNRYKQKLVSINDDGSNAEYGNIDENGDDVDADNKVAANGAEKIYTYENKVWHTIEFPKGGDSETEIADKRATFNGNETGNADVKGDGTVYMFRKDSIVPEIGGYDADNDGNYEPAQGDQPSLREFLRDPNQDGNNNDAYVNADGTIIDGKLEPNQRIVTFEIGQENQYLDDGTTPNPGFDFQDNMFIMTSDAFLPQESNDDDGGYP